MKLRLPILMLAGLLASSCEFFPVNRIESTQRNSNWTEFQALLSEEARTKIQEMLALVGPPTADGATWCDVLAGGQDWERGYSEIAQFLQDEMDRQREQGQAACDERCIEDFLRERRRIRALYLECSQVVETLRAAR